MRDYVSKNIKLESVPDPWQEKLRVQGQVTHPAWQFPLDTSHEIEAAPAVDGILSPATDPNLPKIMAPQPYSVQATVGMLLEEELKIHGDSSQHLWGQVRDTFTLLWSDRIEGGQRPPYSVKP